MKVSCVIVTKDRPTELTHCLESLRRQTRLADQIIVIEGGTSRLASTDDIDYRVCEPGITRQRNVARTLVRPDADIVIYLDDDTVAEPTMIEKVVRVFSTRPDVVGLTGTMNGEERAGILKRFFGCLTLLYSGQPYGITAGIFNTISPAAHAQAVAWLPGAFMCYRWPQVRDVAFDEQFSGYGLGEDLDFSLQVKPRGLLWVDPTIQVQHNHAIHDRDWKVFGYMRIVNRAYVRRKHFQKQWRYWLGMWWANGWLLLINAVRAHGSRRYRAEWLGEWRGVRQLIDIKYIFGYSTGRRPK